MKCNRVTGHDVYTGASEAHLAVCDTLVVIKQGFTIGTSQTKINARIACEFVRIDRPPRDDGERETLARFDVRDGK